MLKFTILCVKCVLLTIFHTLKESYLKANVCLCHSSVFIYVQCDHLYNLFSVLCFSSEGSSTYPTTTSPPPSTALGTELRVCSVLFLRFCFSELYFSSTSQSCSLIRYVY